MGKDVESKGTSEPMAVFTLCHQLVGLSKLTTVLLFGVGLFTCVDRYVMLLTVSLPNRFVLKLHLQNMDEKIYKSVLKYQNIESWFRVSYRQMLAFPNPQSHSD